MGRMNWDKLAWEKRLGQPSGSKPEYTQFDGRFNEDFIRDEFSLNGITIKLVQTNDYKLRKKYYTVSIEFNEINETETFDKREDADVYFESIKTQLTNGGIK